LSTPIRCECLWRTQSTLSCPSNIPFLPPTCPPAGPKAEALFALFDKDGSGCVDVHEFSELCERLDSDVPHASDARSESQLKSRARAIVRSEHFYYFMSAVSILNAVALYLPRWP
jgi:hypothetical protein